ncbi:MAG TPA: EAL domain-containing protein [Pseudonocardia sp.]|nr:EAL domain-containing protein [Pseudonocardia sp.]
MTSLQAVGFLFGSMSNLTTGAVVGVEMLPRPRYPEFADVLAGVRSGGGGNALDAALAVEGLRWAVEASVRLPIHLNLAAATVIEAPAELDELHAMFGETHGVRGEVVMEIGRPLGETDDLRPLLAGARELRERGYRLLIDGLVEHDRRLPLVLELCPDQVKLHPKLVAALAKEHAGATTRALADALLLCRSVGAEIAADGITSASQLEALRVHGVRCGQGSLIAMPSRRPLTQPILALISVPPLEPHGGGGSHPRGTDTAATDTIGTFARSATTAPVDATGADIREVFRDSPEVTVVVLIDENRRPVGALDRNRFLLAVSGPYGHALRAGRPARLTADNPRILPAAAHAGAALDLLEHGDPQRRNDDIVIVDAQGRCVGIAHVADVLRGIAELAHSRALALHPATRLAGPGVVRRALASRIGDGDDFAVGWLVPDLGPAIDRFGFAGADTAQRLVADAIRAAVGVDLRAEIAHVLDGVVVVTTAGRVKTVDRVVRHLLHEQDGPSLYSAWLTCSAGELGQPLEADGLLTRLIEHARACGPGTALWASPATVDDPTHLAGVMLVSGGAPASPA